MNKELQDRVFKVPKYILDNIKDVVNSLNGEYVRGIDRANRLLSYKTVTYGQLKKIIHELNEMDKLKDKQKYELAGGDLMLNWSRQFLDGERNLIKSRKDSKEQSDNMSGLTGERKNSHLKKHKKKSNFNIGTNSLNFMKSNSQKNSISALTDLKLFEEIDRIKKLIIY